MELREGSLRNRIALGWVIMLLILTAMLVFMIIQSVYMDNDFKSLRADPGTVGLKMLSFIFLFYAIMPIYIYFAHHWKPRVFRWLAVVVAVLGFLYFLLHHLGHWQYGQRPDLSSHALDVALHLVTIWVIVSSIQWARFRSSTSE